ncbi:hypothetical protein PTHTG4_27710 [Parageobacillus thermoglucosidasius]|uniref:hypothetical protein n=1 Tax=Parageobacillus thermoglucosidasius TaxID=1426 RepID=UPI000FF97B95|nr:hypothetical protein [Parageobacillus thermoglucosidasius]GCD83707.1 hypothetical protein PTHTG4_27710 [Parageobacillus thermoglucosidasius]
MLVSLAAPTKVDDFFKQLTHVDTLPKFLLWIIAIIISLFPFFKKFLAANTLNDLDHLLITKHESQINKFLITIQDIFFFLIVYVGAATFYIFLIGEKLFTANVFIVESLRICFHIFLITFVLILLKICIETFRREQLYRRITFWLLFINYITSLVLYYVIVTYYFYYEKWKFNKLAFCLTIFPIMLFAIYQVATRRYRQQEEFFYVIRPISEEEFRDRTLAFRYSFDADRMIFTELDDENFERPYVYDRSQNQYFQYIKTKKQINHEIKNKKEKVSADYLLGRTDNPNSPENDDISEELNTLAKINQLIKEYGIEQMGFFDIEKWKSLSEEEIEEIIKHFEWVVHKAKERIAHR